ncbi:MAG: dienelactone hydrolase family protein [Acidobacteria bacterium]|nr:dienelactone hydrolase family protein [Acidobacteriota bacterium]
MTSRFVLTATLLVALPSLAAAQLVTFPAGGEMRQAFVFAPATPPAGARLPVVLAFHGRGDNIRDFQYVNLHIAWRDAIVVYFQALDRDGLSGWQVERAQDGDRDLELVDTALASLRKKHAIDNDRIYATGFSNGAAFTYLLWAERPDVFAAYAVVAGRLRPSVQPKQPRPLLAIAGERDPQILFADQKAAINAAASVNGVRSSMTGCGQGCTVYGSGSPAPVMVWVHPGGHTYPRGTSERIVSFFRDHPRRR